LSGLPSSLAGLILLASCGTPSPTAPPSPPTTAGEQITLAPGQTAQVQGGRVRIIFQSVSGDSRCPVDVTCVWEGDAVVVITTLLEGDTAFRHELHTSGRYPGEVEVSTARIRLMGLAPEPHADQPPAPAAYRATFLVTPR